VEYLQKTLVGLHRGSTRFGSLMSFGWCGVSIGVRPNSRALMGRLTIFSCGSVADNEH
jgi:hypothetical protein